MARVQTWRPAEIDVTGMERLAVLDFTGENGPAVATAVSSKLWENRFYTVVDRSELQPILLTGYGGTPRLEDLIEPARKAGVDAVMLGEVVEYRCEDESFQSTDFDFGHAETRGRGFVSQANGFGVSFNQTLVREGAVTIAFRLVDVETGEVRAARKVSRHYEGRIVNGQGQLPSQGEVLHQLTEECVEEVAQMLAPHPCQSECKLAKSQVWERGSREVSLGVKQAKKGNWQQAEGHWQMALQINPANDAALYNLALAAMNRQSYIEAEEFAMQAVRTEHKDHYVKGLELIRVHRRNFEKTEEQREARVVTADGSIWR